MTATATIEFSVPPERWPTSPPERRGLGRDGVRLMVAETGLAVVHAAFTDLGRHLRPGDVLVVNTSATVPAAIDACTDDGRAVRLHFASPTAEGFWTVEVRTPRPGGGTTPGPELAPQELELRGGGAVQLIAHSRRSPRLWIAAVDGLTDLGGHLRSHGGPIRYSDGPEPRLEDHQTVFATVPGSAEMPSAGRPFTPASVTDLVSRGIVVLPVVLHTGVSSYEDDETPGDERFRVPAVTARTINALRSAGGRVVAVGTTVVRALETVASDDGIVHPGAGVTDLVVTPERGVRAIDGLLTGWHEPRSSHLRLLEAVAGRELLERCYSEALAAGYLWHEFGDELLILR